MLGAGGADATVLLSALSYDRGDGDLPQLSKLVAVDLDTMPRAGLFSGSIIPAIFTWYMIMMPRTKHVTCNVIKFHFKNIVNAQLLRHTCTVLRHDVNAYKILDMRINLPRM